MASLSDIFNKILPKDKDEKSFNLLALNTKAALLIILAASFIAGTIILAKSLGQNWLGQGLHPLQISAGRFSFAWVYLLIIFIIKT